MVKKTTISREYTPDIWGNLEDDKPFVVRHKAPTHNLAQDLLAKPKIRAHSIVGSDLVENEVIVEQDSEKIVRGMVTSIENLVDEVIEDGESTQSDIKTVDDLFGKKASPAMGELVEHLAQYFAKILKEGISEKN